MSESLLKYLTCKKIYKRGVFSTHFIKEFEENNMTRYVLVEKILLK